MLPQDLDGLVTAAQPAVSPDGRTVAFVATRVDAEQNTYRSQIWLVPADGSGPPLPFTSGEHKAGNPTWSPDGGRLAFTSSRGTGEGTRASLQVAPVRSGGEMVALAALVESAHSLAWSPDGRHIAFVTRTRDGRYAEEDERKRAPHRVTRLFSRLDGVGTISDRPQHVYVVPADGSAPPRNLTPGDVEFTGPAWTADSSGLVVSGAAHDSWDLDRMRDLHLVEVATGGRQALTGTTGAYENPAVSPDGTRVVFLGTDDAATHPRNVHVGVVPLFGGAHTWVSEKLDRTFAPYHDRRAPVWLDDTRVLAAVEDRGDVHLYRVSPDGDEPPEAVWDGTGVVTGYDAAGGTVALTLTTPTRPAELCVLEGGRPTRLTDLGSTVARRAEPREYERFTVRSKDTTVDLDAWLVKPPDFDPDRRYPMLVNVHGGPFMQYTNGFFEDVQMQARAGYVVVWTNPRGSSGRDEAFGRAICGPALGGTGWGSVDFDDVMAVLDHVLAKEPYVDATRVGILGGSYGGYLTAWAIGHTDRFRAACVERAVTNLLALESASDLAGTLRRWVGVSHVDDPEQYLTRSPISYARSIKTPLLILHGETDQRSPVEQGEQLFVALRLLCKDVTMVRFPGEGHALSRSGSPAHRRQRIDTILEFFEEHLKGNGFSPRHARP